MNGDFLKPVNPGQPFRPSASFENATKELIRRQRESEGIRGGLFGHAPPTVLVKNTGDGDLSRFAVLAVDDILFTPTDNLDGFKNNSVLIGITPSASYAGRFVILAEAIPLGKIGHAYAVGTCPVQVEVSIEGHLFADVQGSTAKLYSGASGMAQILWKEPGIGTKWAIVRLGGGQGPPVSELLGKITGHDTDPETYTGRIRADDGTFPSVDDAQIVNGPFSTVGAGWRLASGQEVVVVDTGLTTDDGRRIVVASSGRAITTPITTIPPGTGLTLQTDEWDRDTSGQAVEVDVLVRRVWDAVATPKRYRSIVRRFKYDALGNLFHVGPETFADSQNYTSGCA